MSLLDENGLTRVWNKMKTWVGNQLPGDFSGATTASAGIHGLVPAPTTTDTEKFLRGDGSWGDGGKPMVVLSYGKSTWNDFIEAYNNHVIVYCKASSNANPATGNQTRQAFMAYVNADPPTEVEFQYYRSVSSHSDSQQGDQVFIYKLTKTGGWSVTTRNSFTKIVAGSNMTSSYSNGALTLNATGGGTDEKVTQTESTTDENYEVLVSGTASTATTTEGVNKNTKFLYNPYYNSVLIGTKVEGTSNGAYSFGIGTDLVVSGSHSFAQGNHNSATGPYSHAEGDYNLASGTESHAEGYMTTAAGVQSHAEGNATYASGPESHTEGIETTASNNMTHAEGNQTLSSGVMSHAEGSNTVASGQGSHAEGLRTTASGNYSHAENGNALASGLSSHAEGNATYAKGNYSHAEGMVTTAVGLQSHAEGSETYASGSNSHAEGSGTKATQFSAHAEGGASTASGYYAHAEGDYTLAQGVASHAEGGYTYAKGIFSHAEGNYTTATHDFQHVFGSYNEVDGNESTTTGTYIEIVGNGKREKDPDTQEWGTTYSNARTLDWEGNETLSGGIIAHYGTIGERKDGSTIGHYSFSQGIENIASGYLSRAIGDNNVASGPYSRAEGTYCTASNYGSIADGERSLATGSNAHAEGAYTYASNSFAHAEGWNTTASGPYSHAEGQNNYATTAAWGSHVEGQQNTVSGGASHIEGYNNSGSANFIHIEGNGNITNAVFSHVEGYQNTCLGSAAYGNGANHVEGSDNYASGFTAHAEGQNTRSTGGASHSEGSQTTASAHGAHAEGANTLASGTHSHAEGLSTTAYAHGHAEGVETFAKGSYSHAEGFGTTATHDSQHVFGAFNIVDGSESTARGNYIEIVGNGDRTSQGEVTYSNARTLDWSGNEVLSGKLTVGAAPTADMDVATKKYVDDADNKLSSSLTQFVTKNITWNSNPAGYTNGNYYIQFYDTGISTTDYNIESVWVQNSKYKMPCYVCLENDTQANYNLRLSYLRSDISATDLAGAITTIIVAYKRK